MQRLRTGLFVGVILFLAAGARADTTWVAAGWVSGNWTTAGSPYVIYDGWVQVHADSTLTIQPGVQVYFAGPQAMVVYGRLTAAGTVQDSIHFVGADVDTLEDAWRGLVFISTDTSTADSSRLAYAALERANGPGLRPGTGGAIQCLQAGPLIEHSSLRRNCVLRSRVSQTIESRHGGGAYLLNSHARFTDCDFTANNPGPIGLGGGVYFDDEGTEAVFAHCRMYDDTAGSGGAVATFHAVPTFHGCEFFDNFVQFNGGAALIEGATASFDSCTFVNNVSFESGGALFLWDGQHFFDHCDMAGNQSFWGGALYCWLTQPVMEHCLIRDNTAGYGSAMYFWDSGALMYFCTVVQNTVTQEESGAVYLNESSPMITGTIISHNQGGVGLCFWRSPEAQIGYCDLAVNSGGDVEYYPDESAMPAGFGSVTDVNHNGDPCDAYMNIFLDPDFVYLGGEDYHPDWDSPCIDAGSPLYDPDPDGSIPDIGALYRDVLSVPSEQTAVCIYQLAQNYPNPFNAVTRIEFDLPRAGQAELAVYDVTGRLVTTLLSGVLNSGHHNVNWDAGNLSSGVYVYRLTTPEATRAKKMVVLK